MPRVTWKGCPIPQPRRRAMDGPILAIDLGKFNSVCCWYEPESKHCDYATVKTNGSDFRRVLQRRPVSRVVFEAGSPAGWVHDLCGELGLACQVANTVGPAWAWKNVKRKTDRDDALKLAKLGAIKEIPTVTCP